ncbi:restriction endonuclease subunit S [Enterococcus faecium]|uniref:restriction endonuclease subunit S n=1 Tax=Enterococcus TaxID=1350 RepID=UPI00177B74D4|nr:restriction endonuclease subunit S [Enterococcus faecium]MBD9758190.1 restriction endonuclease subunit S [Enterococcus faecium]
MSNDTQPEIRFPGFTEDWEQRKLGEVVESVGTGRSTFTNGIVQTSETPYAVLGSTSVISYDSMFDHSGDFILTARVGANAGNLYKYFGEVKISDNTVYIQANNLDFIYYLLTKYDLKRLSFGTGQPLVKASEVKNLKLNFPQKNEEQQKIGSFFKQLDDTIALHQRKLDLLKETKKGFLQKMFPKNGAKVPEIRFPGFTEDWEQRRLSDVASIVGGGTPSTSNPEYWDGDIDWYAPAEIGDQIYVSKSLKTITELGQQKSSAKILPIGTVLFTSRAGIGNTAILAKEGTTNQGFQSIVPHKNKLDSYFIFSRTHELKRYGEVTGAGSTFAEVSGKQMAKMPILIPCINEQRKIGAFFEQLDTTITLHQRELDVLKETKKGFLQKMFV